LQKIWEQALLECPKAFFPYTAGIFCRVGIPNHCVVLALKRPVSKEKITVSDGAISYGFNGRLHLNIAQPAVADVVDESNFVRQKHRVVQIGIWVKVNVQQRRLFLRQKTDGPQEASKEGKDFFH
jgi:hypothetical protein